MWPVNSIKVAILCLHTEQTPTAKCWLTAKSLLALEKLMLKKLNMKLDNACAMAKENVTFWKYPVLDELEEHRE